MKSYAMTSRQILAYYRQISSEMFTVVDLETTGGSANFNRIIEISVVQARLKGGILNISTDLINPQTQIPREIIKFTGISQAMVDEVESGDRILPNYLPSLQAGVLTAHNLKFDYSFLQAEYRKIGINFRAAAQLCTVELSRLLLAHLPSRSLPKLVKHFGFKVGKSHRAESDAIACWLLLEHLLNQVNNSEDQEILDLINTQWLTITDIEVIFKISPTERGALLTDNSIITRFSYHRQIKLYQRGSVERLMQKKEDEGEVDSQLSLLL
jgi:DNA polymerase III subunit epsilon